MDGSAAYGRWFVFTPRIVRLNQDEGRRDVFSFQDVFHRIHEANELRRRRRRKKKKKKEEEINSLDVEEQLVSH